MPTFALNAGTEIDYKDGGTGQPAVFSRGLQPVVFSHGWPLTADAFEGQMVFLTAHG